MHLKEVDANLLVILDALLVDASVTRAAERLGRSASAISHALAKLREIFDDELFVRAGQKLVPTAKAQALAPTVHVILVGMESLLRSNKPFDPSLEEREFAIAAPETGELILVQPLRRHLALQAPHVALHWIAGPGEESIDALRSGRCHFAVDIAAGEVPAPDLRAATLFEDRLVILARPGHILAQVAPDAAALAATTHIAVNSLPAFTLLERALAKAGEDCRAPETVSSVLVGLLSVLNSDAVLTVPETLAAILSKQFALATITPGIAPAPLPVRLLWHSSYDRDECHQWIRDEAARIAKRPPAEG